MKKIAYVGIDFLDEALKCLLSRKDIEILKIFTCHCDNKTEFNVEVIELAGKNGIPYTCDRVTEADLKDLYYCGCELLICAGYYYKLPVTKDFPMVNFHPALLPIGRGPWPMPLTILKGLKVSGVTVHKISPSLDEGDIIISSAFDVDDNENLVSFMKKDSLAINELTNKLLDNFDYLYDNAKPQTAGEYWESPVKADYTINLSMSDKDIDLIMRAFFSYEVYLELDDGKCYEMIGARLINEKPNDGKCFVTREGSYIIADRIELLTDNA